MPHWTHEQEAMFVRLDRALRLSIVVVNSNFAPTTFKPSLCDGKVNRSGQPHGL